MEALSSTVHSLASEPTLEADTKPSPQKVCMMQGEASAEIGDELTNNNSMQWPINLEVKQEQDKDDECVPKGPGLYQWFENQALSEAVSSVNVDPVDPHSASIQEILEASRLSKNKDLLQLLDEIGSGDTAALAGNFWQEAGGNEFNFQSVGYSASSTDECQQFSDCQQFRTFFEPLPLVLPSVAGSVNSCSFVQPGEGTVWTGQAAEPERAMTVECIQAGEAAFSLGQSSTSSEDLNDEIKKQEEKKRKRRERNKQCSREFRRKQKVREQLLTRGKAEKEQLLVERYKRIEKTTKILLKIATSSGACEKGQNIINRVTGLINKENLPRAMVKSTLVPYRHVSCTKTQAF